MITQRHKDNYALANRRYGPVIDKMRQHVPKSLAVAHVCSINPTIVDLPKGTKYQRGFLLASVSAARRARVAWSRMSLPLVCSFVWHNDVNRLSYLLYSNAGGLFTGKDEDFWKCVYLEIMLDDAAFTSLWLMTNPIAGQTGGVYGQLKAKVASLKSALPGWTVPKLQKTVLSDMETTFELAKVYGPLTSPGPGRPPYLSSDDARQIFLE